jgi:hypothetical protein
MAKYEGGCACRAVHYETDAEPIVAGHCQCRHCQRLSGAGHLTFAAFPEPAMKITGEIKYWDYKADSGNTATRGHCPTCGSMLLGKTSGMPGAIGINLTSLDDPSKIQPQMVFFSAMGQIWDQIDPALPKFPGMPPM